MSELGFVCVFMFFMFFFFQAEDGIRYLVRSRGLGDVYKRQHLNSRIKYDNFVGTTSAVPLPAAIHFFVAGLLWLCLLYTSDAADERSSVDLGGRRITKKKKQKQQTTHTLCK